MARFGPPRERFAASFIVRLLGKSESFFLQNALFATGRGARDIEFIYVSNSPELAENAAAATNVNIQPTRSPRT